MKKDTPRRIFVVFSPRSLIYAQKCFESLFANSLEPLDVKLITDSLEDKETIINAVNQIENRQLHQWQVIDQNEANERASEQFKNLENLQVFRGGHPCWRKITDPLLFTKEGEEMIILDPDLYFPNKFTFEPTPQEMLLLMWQSPNCLLPPETVRAAFNAPVKLAHHVDIGVAQLRKPIDLEWLNWLLGKLGGKNIPHHMHIEAIVWSALAMELGGGYLNSRRWRCWHRSHWKRILLKSGVPGVHILKMEDLNSIKCLHACGMSKWWVKEACDAGILESNNRLEQSSEPTPFVEFTPQRYEFEQRLKKMLWNIGYYSLINPD